MTKDLPDQEPVKPEPETFGTISDEREWGWGEEIEVIRDFITDKGLDAELTVYARKVADEERAADERREAGR